MMSAKTALSKLSSRGLFVSGQSLMTFSALLHSYSLFMRLGVFTIFIILLEHELSEVLDDLSVLISSSLMLLDLSLVPPLD